MSSMSIGDLARNLVLQRGSFAAKSDVNRLTLELASGRHADQSAAMRGNLQPLAGIESALSRLQGWQEAAGTLSTRLEVVQTSLGALNGIAVAQSEALLRASASHQPALVDLAGLDAREHLDAAMGVLNTQFAGQSVLAGTRGDRAAVADAGALLDALWPVVSGASNPAEAMIAIRDWFDDPAGFDAQIYGGGAVAPGVEVGPGVSISLAVTAADPALKDLLAGLAAGALLDRGLFSGAPEARRQVTQLAGEALAANASDRALLASRVGLQEFRLAAAQTRNGAEIGALGQARLGLIQADPFATASDLSQAETQLGMMHVLTARLQGLSLLGALR